MDETPLIVTVYCVGPPDMPVAVTVEEPKLILETANPFTAGLKLKLS